jgi:hypothetical protein
MTKAIITFFIFYFTIETHQLTGWEPRFSRDRAAISDHGGG